MSSLLIRNLGDMKEQLRIQAVYRGYSMEEEARKILRTALNNEKMPLYTLGGTHS